MSCQQPKKYTLPDLEYGFSDLEPAISAKIMELHYLKHHQGYVNNLNIALEKFYETQDLSVQEGLLSAIKFNGGGHLNHSLFWQNLSPTNKLGGVHPEGALLEAIDTTFGSIDQLIKEMSAKTLAIQGSGWGWLGYDKILNRLVLCTCDNQDPLIAKGIVPLLGIDVWEHAYYLQYENRRQDYLTKIWSIINWSRVSERYEQAKKV